MTNSNSTTKIPINIEAGVSLLISLTLCLSSDENQREIGKSIWGKYSRYIDKLIKDSKTEKFAFNFFACLYSHFRSIAIVRSIFVLRREFHYSKRDLRIRFYERLSGISSLNYEGVMGRIASAIIGGIGGFTILQKIVKQESHLLYILLIVPLVGFFFFFSDIIIRKYALYMSDKFSAETHEKIPYIWKTVAVEGYVLVLYSFIEQIKEIQRSCFGVINEKKYSKRNNIVALIKRSILEINPNYSVSISEIDTILLNKIKKE